MSELTLEKVQLLLEISYCSNGYLVLTTKVQANAGTSPTPTTPSSTNSTAVAAHRPLVVPMSLTMTDLNLYGILKLSIIRKQGTTTGTADGVPASPIVSRTPLGSGMETSEFQVSLNWINDPLNSITISSSFDSLSKVKENLQNEIESRLREALMHDLPLFIYKKSLKIYTLEMH